MQRTLQTVATVSLLGTLMACAQLSGPPPNVPAQQVRMAASVLPDGWSAAEAGYLQGQAAHDIGQWALASLHYEQVLAMAPRHVGALNALGVIHAQAGRTDAALALFARAVALAPGAPYLYNNAGYALLRAERLDEAGAQLRRAQQLDPASLQTQHNLVLWAQATRRAGETPAGEVVQASTWGTRLVAVAPQIYELQVAEPRQAVRLAQAAQPAGGRLAAKRRAGVTLARLLPASGVSPPGQSWPYRQMKTERQLAAGWEALAKAPPTPLDLGVTATAQRPGAAHDAQLRLVLAQALHYGLRPKSGPAT